MHFYIFKRNETLDVLLLPHKGTNMYSFVNLSKGHICPCLCVSIEYSSKSSPGSLTMGCFLTGMATTFVGILVLFSCLVLHLVI